MIYGEEMQRNFGERRISPKKAIKAVEKTATKTVEFTIGFLKWIFMLLICYIALVKD